jgi:predicted metal-dependent hydrolase
MTETVVIDDIQVRVRRSGRRRQVGLTVERDGTLAAAVPVALSTVDLNRIVRGKMLWIHDVLAQRDKLGTPAQAKKFVAGEGFYYLGRKFQLRLLRGTKAVPRERELRLYRGYFEIDADAARRGRELFVNWYSTRTREWVEARMEALQRRLGVPRAQCRVRDLGYRWGSCTKSGTINLHWRTILLPPRVADYVLIHELCHLQELNHGERFWNLVRRGDLEFEAKRRWLYQNGPQFNL